MPIGLVDASWGGTFIEAWSPPEALASCGVDDDGVGNAQNHNEYLWNAMVHPFLRMSIRGVLWYQVAEYDCFLATYILSSSTLRARTTPATLTTTLGATATSTTAPSAT